VSDKLLLDNKNSVLSFRVVEDGIRPVDEADGNLVIDTSDRHQVGRQLTDTLSSLFLTASFLCQSLWSYKPTKTNTILTTLFRVSK